MPAQNELKTKYPGVFYIQGQGARGPEKIFYIRYRRQGKLIVEKAGRQFQDDMTAAKANGIRTRRIEGKEASNKERRAAELAAKMATDGRITIAKLWELYEETDKGTKSRASDESRFNCYLKEVLGDKEPREIIPLEIDRLKRKTLKEKAPKTIKSTLELLQRLIHYGIEHKGTQGLTFSLKAYMPKVNNEVIETLTQKQMKKLVKTLRDSPDVQISRLMMLALYTAMRKGELLKLKWQDVDLDAGFIRLVEPKGKRDMSIPMNQSAREILENHPKQIIPDEPGKYSEYVFANRKGQPFKDIRKRVEIIRKAADLPADFRPIHGLRHVFASTLANSGAVDIYTLQRLLTHKDVKTTSRYAHLLDQRLKDASAVMDRAMEGQS